MNTDNIKEVRYIIKLSYVVIEKTVREIESGRTYRGRTERSSL